MYSFSDVSAIRNKIESNALQAVQEAFPIEDDAYRLDVTDLKLEGPDDFTPSEEKQAILSGYTLFRPLRGTIRLIDKQTNKPVSSIRKRLAAIPFLNRRGNFIINGVNYGMTNQLRLRPGVYTRLTDTGEYEALVNVVGNVGHRYVLDPESGVFFITMGQARIPLLPILYSMGYTPSELEKVWGKDILQRNSSKPDPGAVQRFYKALFTMAPKTGEDPGKRLREFLFSLKFDPTVNQLTLGAPIERMDKKTVLQITEKLLKAARGETTIDDRNHLGFTRVYGPEDLIPEKIRRLSYQLKKLFNRVRARRSVEYFPSGVFDTAVNTAIQGSGLGQALQEINPIETFDTRYRVTRLGEGGIPDVTQVAESLRQLHPSHLGFLDPVLTPESEHVGVDTRFVHNAVRDAKGNIYSRFLDRKTKKPVYLMPSQLFNKVITFPGELESGRPYVRAIINNQHVTIPKAEVDYIVPEPDDFFSPVVNLIPFKQNVYPQRLSMGGRMLTQALPLETSEVPLVQNATADGKSYDTLYGRQIATSVAPVSGTVSRVMKDHIVITGSDGKPYNVYYYRNLPWNRKTFYDEQPLVAAGDKVTKGQPLTKSNYTNENGTFALGRNLKTAYVAFDGLNYEDSAVMSESAANKMRSIHTYQEWVDRKGDTVFDKRKFAALFPGKYEKAFYNKYTDEGVVLPGTILQKGDPIVLMAAKRAVPGISKALLQDVSVLWEMEDPGEVTDVAIGPKHVNVIIKAVHPFRVGDKIAGRYGDKHIIGAIIPDSQMPTDENDEPYELVLNPLGVQGRVNVAQLWEVLLSNVAKKQGKPVLIRDFSGNTIEQVSRILEQAGIGTGGTVNIKKYGTSLTGVPAGYRYMMKLHHMAESKLGSRGIGEYTSEGIPVHGGSEGAKKVGLLEMLGLLAHGAYHTSRDAGVIRGQANKDYWQRIQLGYDIPPVVEPPFVYRKFLEQLRAAGLNPKSVKDTIHVYALTKDNVRELTKERFLENAEGVRYKNDELQPIPGGLFDPSLTGGLSGERWAAIKLALELPNPLMEVPIRKVLGLTEDEFLKILTGAQEFGTFGKGPQAIKKALSSLDIDATLKHERGRLNDLKGAGLDQAVQRIRILQAMKDYGVSPQDLFWDRVPVLPPVFRPAGLLTLSDLPIMNDANHLYKDLFELNQNYKLLKENNLDDARDVLLLYNALKAIIGLGDPVHPKFKAQGIKGLIPQIIGSSPKYGVMQKKLLSATVDLVGRATIVPNANLGLDEVAIPENSAWNIYKPFVVRRLVKEGYTRLDAVDAVEKKTERAKKALLDEMRVRPVIVSRAPVLHKYGIMAAWPRLTSNLVMETHPYVIGSFGGDYDGDAHFNKILWAEIEEEGKEHIPSTFIGSSNMFARSRLKIPHLENARLHISDLEDFPHGDYLKTTSNQDGQPIEWYAVPENIRVLSYRENGELSWVKPSVWSKHSPREVVIVNLKSGQQIYTDDDPRAVVGVSPADLQLKRYTPEEAVKSNVFVPRVSRYSVSSKNIIYRIKVSDYVAGGNVLGISNFIDLDINFGYIIGCAIGDWAVKEKSSDCLLSVFAAFIDVLTGQEPEQRHLPDFFFSAPSEFRWGLFCGLMDTHGEFELVKAEIDDPPQLEVTYEASNLRLARELVILANTLHIKSKITKMADRWVVRFSSWDISQSKEILINHMVNQDKRKKLNTAQVEKPPVLIKEDVIPISESLAANILQLMKDTSTTNKICLAFVRAQERGCIPRETALRSLQYIPIEKIKTNPHWERWIMLLYDRDITWDKVKSIEKTGIKEVGYDLTVPGFETFVSWDGIVLSNTMQFHVPADPVAVKEAIEKLMPSKNLISFRRFRAHQLPTLEYLAGLHYLSGVPPAGPPVQVKDVRELLQRMLSGEIKPHQRVEVKNDSVMD